MEKKTLEFKGTMDDSGSLEGFGAVYGNIDSYGDVILPNSIANLSGFVNNGSILVGHDWGDLGIATIDDAKETEHGLWFKATYHTDEVSQRYRLRASERLSRGKSLGLSIGYRTIESESGTKDGTNVRYIKRYELFEISQVMTPANDQARATAAKSFGEEMEDALAAAESLIQRAKDIKTLRARDGRDWPSGDTRSRIEVLATEIEMLPELVKSLLQPQPQEVSEDEMAEIHRSMMALRLKCSGIR